MKRLCAALATLAAAAALSLPAQAAVVSFSPASQTVANPGDSVSVDVRVSGLGTEVVSAFDFNIFFNPAILTNTSIVFNEAGLGVTPGFAFADDWFADADTSVAGEVKLTLFSWLTSDGEIADIQADDSFTLFTLNFDAAANGATNLFFGAPPDFDRNLVGREALTLDASYGQACVAVGTGATCDNQVPEPASYALALAALGAASLARRRAKAKTAA